jgi:UDP-N-acetylmuramate dehydrogenase
MLTTKDSIFTGNIQIRYLMSYLKHNFSLKAHHSFGTEATASLFAAPHSTEELSVLLDTYDTRNHPFLVIGEGSNILFTGDFEGLVMNPQIRGVEVTEEDDSQVTVRIGAAENWDQWVERAVHSGWYGLENLSLIPGSAGAAPVQNIGAYGTELKDVLAWVEAWDMHQKRMVKLHKNACKLSYRNSLFKTDAQGRYIITHVVFQLSKIPQMQLDYGPVKEIFSRTGGSTPADLRNVIISIRQQKLPDPEEHGNAGSFFQNPLVDKTLFKCIRVDYPDIPSFREKDNQVKIPAAWLIEQTGWKGKRLGHVGTWPAQPLVIVNYNNASGQEILDFSEQVRADVEKKFGIFLEREVQVVG